MTPSELHSLLPDLATFASVVEAGNFSSAARLLGTTPSTVSRQMQRLERALGVKLLERSTRSLRLTESGTQVYHYCHNMVHSAADAVDTAGHLSAEAHGRVSVSAPIAYAKSVVHPLIDGFLRVHPRVQVQLFFEDREVDPVRDPIDLVLRPTPTPPPGLIARQLGTVRWLLCASPAYLHERGIPEEPEALRQHDCLQLGDHANDGKWIFRRGTQMHTVEVHGRYIVNDVSARTDATLSGWGIASLPDYAVKDFLREGSLRQVLSDWSFEPRVYSGPVWLLYPRNRFLPLKVRAMIDWLTERLSGS
ncbi:LysR family transcriptional regulator [Burkholderia sp. 22PA0099]|uniref:LysR family transcriptional regulator n=1 Tax=Burkholderia sp. 22PA0099 TaxID=3237372 RepID=UPI0039C31CA4